MNPVRPAQQHFTDAGVTRPQPSGEPERCRGELELLRAVLADVRDMLSGDTRTTAFNVNEAHDWVKSDHNYGAFSFVGCCEFLRLDVQATRYELLAMYARALTDGRFAVENMREHEI